jgi:diacylglycerol O-acyltransferase
MSVSSLVGGGFGLGVRFAGMPLRHLDRLSAIDASFLHQESESSHMHIGGTLVCEGPSPALAELLEHIRGRLYLIPRYRQKLAVAPRGAGRPLWIDDTAFNLAYHVRRIELPTPGGDAQLLELVSMIAARPLDRARPLWECWLVEGLSESRFALVFKHHHALFDGVSGVDLATVLFDLTREPVPLNPGLVPWRPQPEPTPAELIGAEVRATAGHLTELGAGLLGAARRPSAAAARAQETLAGLGEVVSEVLSPAPATPLNVPIGPRRRFAIVRQRLEDYKLVKDHFGVTVNDVVLAVVSGALARWLEQREFETEGVELRALVPVSVRAEHERHTLGNRLTVMRAPLPVGVPDEVGRLRLVGVAMAGLKESKQAIGAATLAAAGNLAPPAVLAQASRIPFSSRIFNLLVTNVPGPQAPLYVLGRELQDMLPLAFLAENHALAVAIISYNGLVEYGLLGDHDALPDIGVIANGVELALGELTAAVGRSEAAPAGTASE